MTHYRRSKPHVTPVLALAVIAAASSFSPVTWAQDNADNAVYTFSGTATGVENQEAIYTEDHQVTGSCINNVFQPLERQVTYRRADEAKTELATKTMRYDQSPQRPSYTFDQPNVGEKINVRNENDKQLRINADMGEDDKKAFELALNDQVVVDAGFLSLIRQHWHALNAGEEVSFEFLSPTRGKTYDFIAEPVSDSRIDVTLAIKIRPAGMFLNWLVDPVLLGFDDEGQLTDYIGLSNIRKNSESNYVVHLQYQSADLPCALISPKQP
ncbi:hypothetical protein [Marinobacter sp. V034]|uniref:hypothetical protein n=1 Tax=Marinobacter sp. V034 TaxID=3459610 RepID=UPI0040449D12